MEYHIILRVQDKMEDHFSEYCIPVIKEMTDQAKSTAKEQRSANYSDDKKKIIKMCAPDETEFQKYFDDIINYYQKYFNNGGTERERKITVTVVCDKYNDVAPAYSTGSTIVVYFFNIIIMLINFNKKEINDDKVHTKEYQLVGSRWKKNTKQLFSNQLRYYMAHEMYHVLQGFELEKAGIVSNDKLDIVNEILAEYFALAYMNDFCNATGAFKWDLDLCETAYFSEDDRKKGNVSWKLKESVKVFDRMSGDNRSKCNEDYHGGALLLALAIKDKCENFGNENAFYTEINAMVMENRAGDALEKIISRRGEILKQ